MWQSRPRAGQKCQVYCSWRHNGNTFLERCFGRWYFILRCWMQTIWWSMEERFKNKHKPRCKPQRSYSRTRLCLPCNRLWQAFKPRYSFGRNHSYNFEGYNLSEGNKNYSRSGLFQIRNQPQIHGRRWLQSKINRNPDFNRQGKLENGFRNKGNRRVCKMHIRLQTWPQKLWGRFCFCKGKGLW